MATAKLSKANEKTLEDLAKNPKMTPEMLELFRTTILEVKESSEPTERKARSLSLHFTAIAAKIFGQRIVEQKNQTEVETDCEVDTAKVNASVREVGYKVVRILLNKEYVTADQVQEVLKEFGTADERKKKDEKAEAPSSNGTTNETTSEPDIAPSEGEGELSEMSADDVDKLLSGE